MSIIRLGGLSRRLGGRAMHPSIRGRSFSRGGAIALPPWLASAGVNEWIAVSGTTAPSNLGDFSGIAVRDDSAGVQIYSALGGGHSGNNTDNSVKVLQLNTAAPAWSTLRSASSTAGSDLTGAQAYYTSDGRPMPRHLYSSAWWIPERSEAGFGGIFWGSAGSGNFPYFDLFSPGSNDWELPTPIDDTPTGAGGNRVLLSARDPSTGYLYATQRSDAAVMKQLDPSGSGTWSDITLSGASCGSGGNAFDTARGKIFQFSCDDWFFNNTTGTPFCVQIALGGARTAIALNSSAGKSDMLADINQWTTPSTIYDPQGDCFYVYNGATGSLSSSAATKVYKITPNGTSTWDIALLSVTGVTPDAHANGVMNRFFYVPRWRCVVLVVPGANVYAMRVA